MSNVHAVDDKHIDLIVEKEEDWNKFSDPKRNLDVIVDPMVFRSGHLLIKGKRGAQGSSSSKSSDEVWEALSQNIGSLVAFFDALILNEHLPIIDYGYTFDSHVGFQANELVQFCNANEKILDQVHVMGDAYQKAREDAIAALDQRGPIPFDMVTTVRADMSAFDYDWNPYIPGLMSLLSEDEKALRQFMFGSLLFSTYAQRTGAGHLLQPKRSKLYLATSLVEGSTPYGDEEALLAEVRKIANQAVGQKEAGTREIDPLPPFLPYLLRKDPKTPKDLLQKALALRNEGEVKDYRDWRVELVRNWRDKGRIDLEHEKKLRKITQAVMGKLQVQDGPSLGWELKATFVPVSPFVQPGVGVKGELPIGKLWGWMLGQLPGRRYSKLLMRMMLADREYRRIDHQLRTIWNAD